ncbi:MAG: diaminopimelate dehydrogenase, partial [Clostridia bacterium]|nr:diaminopimelate dehydrogenase [Clostridia bacterium]
MKIGIYGYGNLGRGVELCAAQSDDIETFGVFTRRDPASVKTALDAKVFPAQDAAKYKDDIDVMIICGGSATDLPKLTPMLANDFCVVDSFD